MDDLAPLRTLRDWRTSTAALRARAGAALAAQTGFAEGDPAGPDALRTLRHPSGLDLVAIPGGVYWRGLTDADLYAFFEHGGERVIARAEEIRAEAELAAPRIARVAPFLCAAQQWANNGPCGFGDEPRNHRRDGIDGILTEHGARLPSADEWEWVAREGDATPWVGVSPSALPVPPRKIPVSRYGGPNGFGVGNLHLGEVGELVTDSEIESLRGGHAMWQDDIEAIALLSGYVWPLAGAKAMPFRFVFSLGLEAPTEEPADVSVPDDEVGHVVARFRGA